MESSLVEPNHVKSSRSQKVREKWKLKCCFGCRLYEKESKSHTNWVRKKEAWEFFLVPIRAKHVPAEARLSNNRQTWLEIQTFAIKLPGKQLLKQKQAVDMNFCSSQAYVSRESKTESRVTLVLWEPKPRHSKVWDVLGIPPLTGSRGQGQGRANGLDCGAWLTRERGKGKKTKKSARPTGRLSTKNAPRRSCPGEEQGHQGMPEGPRRLWRLSADHTPRKKMWEPHVHGRHNREPYRKNTDIRTDTPLIHHEGRGTTGSVLLLNSLLNLGLQYVPLERVRRPKPCLKDIKWIFHTTTINFSFLHFWRNYKENRVFDFKDMIFSITKRKKHFDSPWIFLPSVRGFIVLTHPSYFQHKWCVTGSQRSHPRLQTRKVRFREQRSTRNEGRRWDGIPVSRLLRSILYRYLLALLFCQGKSLLSLKTKQNGLRLGTCARGVAGSRRLRAEAGSAGKPHLSAALVPSSRLRSGLDSAAVILSLPMTRESRRIPRLHPDNRPVLPDSEQSLSFKPPWLFSSCAAECKSRLITPPFCRSGIMSLSNQHVLRPYCAQAAGRKKMS